jgi:hypothetical protein
MRSSLVALSAVFGLVLVSSACVSKPMQNGEIVERSAEAKPPWALGEFPEQNSSEVFVLFQRGGLTRLELGLKQTQAAALEQACQLVQQRMKKELQESAIRAQVLSVALQETIATQTSQLESLGLCPDVSPKFVYWELLRKDTAEGSRQTYEVFLLLAMKKRQYLDALDSVLEAIKNTGVAGGANLSGQVAEDLKE